MLQEVEYLAQGSFLQTDSKAEAWTQNCGPKSMVFNVVLPPYLEEKRTYHNQKKITTSQK